MKLFQVPINHPYIQNLTAFDLSFIDWSTALDDPKFKAKMENMFHDDEFDEFWENPEADFWDEEFEEHSEAYDCIEQPDSVQEGEETTSDGSFINQDKKLVYEQNKTFSDDDEEYAYIPNEAETEEIQDWEVVEDE